MKKYPKIGIRPTIDGRQGGVRESLEEKTMNLAKAVAELISNNLKNGDGSPVECVIADSTIGRVAESAACAEKFEREGVGSTITVTSCWCYGAETMDMNPHYPKAVWGFNGTERPGAVYLAAVLAGHAQKGLPAFGIYGRDVQDLDDNTIPEDVSEKILRFARAAQAVATMRGKSYLSMGSVSMGIAGSIVNPDFFQEYLGMRNESIDLTEIIRRMDEGIYDHEEYAKAMAWTEKNCKTNEGEDFKNRPEKRKTREQKDADWEFIVKMTIIMRDLMTGNPKLKEMGFKVVVSQDPVISQANKKQWEEADRLGYFVKDSTNGKSYDMPWPWGGNCGVVDFTLPAVADWWGTYQQKPIDDGISGFWTDMGEPAWSNEEQTERLVMKHHLGMHDEIHNVYGLTWDKVVKEQFEKRNPNRRVFQMTRAAYAGLQRYTFGWTGDCGNGDDVLQGWGQLANQIPVILSAGLGVIPFTTCDITGYCGDIEDYPSMAELYTRWIQFGAFNPLSRIHHEGDNPVEPWLFGPEAEKNAKEAIELKYRLLPYIYTYAREAHDTGLPIMRPLFLEYPADMETFSTDGQFLFGQELLVAPVVKKGARTKNVYLPEGTWIDYNNKQTVYTGEQWTTVEAPLSCIPMFVKQGSIIPTMPVMNYTHEKPVYPLIFEVFPAPKGEEASFTLYEDEGEDLGYQRDEFAKTPVRFRTEKGGYLLSVGAREGKGYAVPAPRNFIFRMYLKTAPKGITVQGKKVKKVKPERLEENPDDDTESMVWSWDKATGICSLRMPDRGEESRISLRL